jgi:hypothetical protein
MNYDDMKNAWNRLRRQYQQPHNKSLIQIDDLLSFLRTLRRGGFKIVRVKDRPIWQVFGDTPQVLQEIYVDTTRKLPRGTVYVFDGNFPPQPKLEQEKPKFLTDLLFRPYMVPRVPFNVVDGLLESEAQRLGKSLIEDLNRILDEDVDRQLGANQIDE